MGLVALDYEGLVAWQIFSGLKLTPWEAETLCNLSREYVKQASVSSKVDCPSPWIAKLPPKEEIAQAMKNALRSLSKRGK